MISSDYIYKEWCVKEWSHYIELLKEITQKLVGKNNPSTETFNSLVALKYSGRKYNMNNDCIFNVL